MTSYWRNSSDVTNFLLPLCRIHQAWHLCQISWSSEQQQQRYDGGPSCSPPHDWRFKKAHVKYGYKINFTFSPYYQIVIWFNWLELILSTSHLVKLACYFILKRLYSLKNTRDIALFLITSRVTFCFKVGSHDPVLVQLSFQIFFCMKKNVGVHTIQFSRPIISWCTPENTTILVLRI